MKTLTMNLKKPDLNNKVSSGATASFPAQVDFECPYYSL